MTGSTNTGSALEMLPCSSAKNDMQKVAKGSVIRPALLLKDVVTGREGEAACILEEDAAGAFID